ncbi:MAG TPA: GWxTD domain-containing protein [Gemmatimonadales bacterium]|nr:GWxTD domain-containing protein [Gemmatimonadales bacterium]
MLWLILLAVAPRAAATQSPSPPPASSARPAASRDVTIGAVRSYRGNRTLINGFVRVPHALLEPVTIGAGGFAEFRLDVGVVDARGNVLATDSWTRRVPWTASQPRGAASVEMMTFTVDSGAYEIRAITKDSASGRQSAAMLPVQAFRTRPPVSDLLLAPQIRRAAPGDTSTGPGELRKGDLLITAAPDLALSPTQAALFYYCEVYRDSAGEVPWALRVRGEDGRAIVSTPATPAPIAVGGGVITGSVDLAGLPAGSYRLELVIGAPDSVTRSASFRMAGFEVEQQMAQQAQTSAVAGDVFSQMTEAELDTLFTPLFYLAPSSELTVYRGLTLEGKRRFLREFWRQRDPTPGTPGNELQDGFYQRLAEANRRFREGGSAEIPGWRTDRGRVFIVNGEPDEIMRRPVNGPSNPWEAWKYTRPRPRKYVFYDQTRLGNYQLIYTDDRKEKGMPGWERMVGQEAVQDIARF